MRKWFIADTHLSHKKILAITQRPYDSIEDHDTAVLAGINSRVKYRDRLYILGDFSFGDIEAHRKRIICSEVVLIRGNHDIVKNWMVPGVFSQVVDTKEVKVRGEKCFLSHYPHFFWPASHYGSYHLYGHLHGQREETMSTIFPERRSMDVGVDTAILRYGEPIPYSEEDIIQILGERTGHDPVQWYRDKLDRDKVSLTGSQDAYRKVCE